MIYIAENPSLLWTLGIYYGVIFILHVASLVYISDIKLLHKIILIEELLLAMFSEIAIAVNNERH